MRKQLATSRQPLQCVSDLPSLLSWALLFVLSTTLRTSAQCALRAYRLVSVPLLYLLSNGRTVPSFSLSLSLSPLLARSQNSSMHRSKRALIDEVPIIEVEGSLAMRRRRPFGHPLEFITLNLVSERAGAVQVLWS